MIYFAIALFFFIIASFNDAKKHEVPPSITHSLLIIGLALHFAESVLNTNAAPIAWSAAMVLSCFAFSYALYLLGVWAGGDVKLFTSLGAILPYHGSLFYFPFAALAASLIAVFPTLFFYVAYRLAKVKGFFKKTKGIFMLGLRRSLSAPFAIMASYFLASSAGFPPASMPLFLVLYFAGKPGLIFSMGASVFSFYLNARNLYLFSQVFAASLVFFVLMASYSAAKKYVLRETKRVSSLREGDILAKNLVKKNGEFVFEEPTLFSITGKNIVLSALNAGGLEKRDISLLKKLKIREVELKKSVPFVPVFTLGLIIAFVLEMLLY
ncbi:MAG: prepilin peptidase [archaeon]